MKDKISEAAAGPSAGAQAILMELATLDDPPAVRRHAADALAVLPEGWQAATTADDLDLLIRTRAEHGAEVEWLAEISAAWDLGRLLRPEWP